MTPRRPASLDYEMMYDTLFYRLSPNSRGPTLRNPTATEENQAHEVCPELVQKVDEKRMQHQTTRANINTEPCQPNSEFLILKPPVQHLDDPSWPLYMISQKVEFKTRKISVMGNF